MIDSFFSRSMAYIVMVLALAGCGSGSQQQAAGSSSAIIYPAGIATDEASIHSIKGIYTGDTTCCWLTDNATFLVPANAADTSISLKTYLPEMGNKIASNGTITLVGQSPSQANNQTFKTGTTTLTFPIFPGTFSNGFVSVHLKVYPAFVPKDIGLNGDVRKLSVVLESAEAH